MHIACTSLEKRIGYLLLPPDVWAYWARNFGESTEAKSLLKHLATAINSRWRPFEDARTALKERARAYGQTLEEAKSCALMTTLFSNPDSLTRPSPADSSANGDTQPGAADDFQHSLDELAGRISRATERELEREIYSRPDELEAKAELFLRVDQELADGAVPDDAKLEEFLGLMAETDLGTGEEVIRLHLQGLTDTEIAKALRITEINVRVRRSRALTKLKATAESVM